MTIKMYVNSKREPIAQIETEGGEMVKHQIAALALLHLDEVKGDIKKVRFVFEED